MLRLSKLTDYGIVLLAQIARSGAGDVHSAKNLSGETGLPLPTVEKLLKQLQRVGLVVSKRGPKGGYTLVKSSDEITLANIIELLQGAVALTECTDESNSICDVVSSCCVRGHWPLINQVVRSAFNSVTLRDLSIGIPREMSFENGIGSSFSSAEN